MNDPNGMVYFEGEYHLFYQYYPEGTTWGPMHWGHAVSEDLFHWKDLPIALYPDDLGYIFSGSAVIDWTNTSGFSQDGKPAMVAIFTYHDPVGAAEGRNNYQTQGIAYSLDRGRSWIKYCENPVINNPGEIDFRDPKVFWYAPDRQWIMVLAVRNHIAIYSSADLKKWTHLSDFDSPIGAYGGVWECPDLFPLVSEDGEETRWVMIVNINPGAPNGGSGTMYFIGNFDGNRFDNQNTELHWIDYGKDNYAGVTWSGITEEDGRRIFLGWMSNWQYGENVPTELWRSAMTLPRELNLRKIDEDWIVVSNPVHELEKLVCKTHQIESLILTPNESWVSPTFDVPFSFEISVAGVGQPLKDFKFVLKNADQESVSLSYSALSGGFVLNRDNSGWGGLSEAFGGDHFGPFPGIHDNVKIRFVVDRTSLECFIDGGLLCMTDIFFPTNSPLDCLKMESTESLHLTELICQLLSPSMER